MSFAESGKLGSLLMSKPGLKFLALLLGVMAWYLIQDAIRIESVQLQASLDSKPVKASPVSVLRLDRLPVSVLAPPGAWECQVSPAFASVWLEGATAELDRIEKSGLRLFVDGVVIAHAGESVMLPVKAHLPAEVRVKAQVEPMLVEVSVKPSLKGGP